MALAETKITDLEAMGRTVLLVALGGRLVGVVGLQDGLRPGARAAVQHLLDVGVEPVLLSGDARETCEALGRALDIDHIRPELLPAERGDEIRRLADGGAVVAVIGRSPADDASLAAADVSIALVQRRLERRRMAACSSRPTTCATPPGRFTWLTRPGRSRIGLDAGTRTCRGRHAGGRFRARRPGARADRSLGGTLARAAALPRALKLSADTGEYAYR